ncbi:hypothetical protein [Algoriphagus namhaensis]
MKNLINAFFVTLMLILSSCREMEQPQFATVNVMAFITVLDQQGNNLLNPNIEGSFKANEIKIFYEREGKMEEFFEGHLDMPRNFRIVSPEAGNDYLLALALDA